MVNRFILLNSSNILNNDYLACLGKKDLETTSAVYTAERAIITTDICSDLEPKWSYDYMNGHLRTLPYLIDISESF